MRPIHCKLLVLIASSLSFSFLEMNAQNRFHIMLDYHYNIGIQENGYAYHLTSSDGGMSGNSLHLSALYDVTNHISVGAGMGADRYEMFGYNTFPAFAILHYRPALRRLPNGYIYTNLGYAIANSDNITPGLMWDAGIGYKKMFRKHFGLNFQLGYNFKQFANIPTYEITIPDYTINYIGKKSNYRHSISLGIGLIF